MLQDPGTGRWSELVAKSFKEAMIIPGVVDSVKDWHYREVESQVVAKYFADEFNRRGPPKNVDFIEPYCVQLHRRPGSVCI